MECECGGHQFGSQPARWIVSVMVISLGSSLPYGLRVWWASVWSLPCHMDCECGGHQFGSQPCHMDCECGGHQFGSQPAIWIVSVVGISLGPSLPYGL